MALCAVALNDSTSSLLRLGASAGARASAVLSRIVDTRLVAGVRLLGLHISRRHAGLLCNWISHNVLSFKATTAFLWLPSVYRLQI